MTTFASLVVSIFPVVKHETLDRDPSKRWANPAYFNLVQTSLQK